MSTTHTWPVSVSLVKTISPPGPKLGVAFYYWILEQDPWSRLVG